MYMAKAIGSVNNINSRIALVGFSGANVVYLKRL